MSILQRLEKISAKLFQDSLRTFHFKDVVVHRRAKPKSLIENLALYPNAGKGFHVRRSSWNSQLYIRITETMMKSNRFGKLRGQKYFRGRAQWNMPKKFNGASKRGIWEYELGEAEPVQLDNGMVYTLDDYKAFMQSHKIERITPKSTQQEQFDEADFEEDAEQQKEQ